MGSAVEEDGLFLGRFGAGRFGGGSGGIVGRGGDVELGDLSVVGGKGFGREVRERKFGGEVTGLVGNGGGSCRGKKGGGG